MKIKIEFERYTEDQPCCAKAYLDDQVYFGFGKTWNEAKEELVKKMVFAATNQQPIPISEEIEI